MSEQNTSAIQMLQRVRRIRERMAELDWMEAQAAQRDQEAVTRDNAERAVALLDGMGPTSEDVMLTHLYALQLEVTARRDLQLLEHKRAQTARKQTRMQAAQLSVKVVEQVEESRAEERAIEDRRPVQNAMDELAVKSWWRRSAS
jgi:flagellar export protein FliJ